jgi:hypothetical protein
MATVSGTPLGDVPADTLSAAAVRASLVFAGCWAQRFVRSLAYGGFHKWGIPKMDGCFRGTPNFRKPLYNPIYIYIYIIHDICLYVYKVLLHNWRMTVSWCITCNYSRDDCRYIIHSSWCLSKTTYNLGAPHCRVCSLMSFGY